MNNKTLTLGSLFSGSGGFELGGILCGIKPVWASEIEPFPIRVTTKRIPDMKHLGDISRIKGSEIEPVDIITFGSPCFPAGTLVLTDSGLTEIEDIHAGDMVLTHRGRWRKVTATGSKTAPTIRLKGNHCGLVCTGNHPIYSKCDNDYSWIHAENMHNRLWGVPNSTEYLPIPENYPINEKMKPMPEFSEGFFYFVGRWLGDGWVRNGQRPGRPYGQRNGTICLCDSENKIEELKKTISCISERYSIEHCGTCVKIRCTGIVLCDWLTENFGEYAYGKKIPSWVYSMDETWRKALLKGILDSDGYKKKTSYRVTTVSKKLAFGIRLLAESLGYATSVYFNNTPDKYQIQGRTVNQRDSYTTEIYLNAKRISDRLASWYRVKSIIPEAESAVVYNMTVEEDNSYTADGIIVHNCQDMSIAGKREGLDGNRSGLFHEAIRIVREMRQTTDGQYPRFIVWENVPGAFSSNKGDDFRAVIQEIVNVRYKNVSVPKSEKWAPGGLIVEDDFSLAWRVLDAQYWGVPQRRKRIYLVADFRGQCAGKILFESEGLSGNTQTGILKEQDSSDGTAEGAGSPEHECLMFENHSQDSRYRGPLKKAQPVTSTFGMGGNNQPLVMKAPTFDVRFTSEGTRNARQNCYETATARTIDTGGNAPDSNQGGVAVVQPKVYGICSKGSNAMLSDNPRSGFYEAKTTRTLDANGGSPSCNQGGMAIVAIEGNGARPSHQGCGFSESDKMFTLNATEHHGVAYGIGRTVFCQAYNSLFSFPIEEEKAQTVLSTGPGAVASPAYGIDRAAFNQGKNAKFGIAVEKEKEPPIVARGPNAVADPHWSTSKASFFTNAVKEQTGALVATDYKDPPIVNDRDDVRYIVRRLTPTECARLQGFPNWWCADLGTQNPSEDEISWWRDVFLTFAKATGKTAKQKSESWIIKWLENPHSDASEYKMWGNGVALPCVIHVLSGISYFSQITGEDNV